MNIENVIKNLTDKKIYAVDGMLIDIYICYVKPVRKNNDGDEIIEIKSGNSYRTYILKINDDNIPYTEFGETKAEIEIVKDEIEVSKLYKHNGDKDTIHLFDNLVDAKKFFVQELELEKEKDIKKINKRIEIAKGLKE